MKNECVSKCTKTYITCLLLLFIVLYIFANANIATYNCFGVSVNTTVNIHCIVYIKHQRYHGQKKCAMGINILKIFYEKHLSVMSINLLRKQRKLTFAASAQQCMMLKTCG